MQPELNSSKSHLCELIRPDPDSAASMLPASGLPSGRLPALPYRLSADATLPYQSGHGSGRRAGECRLRLFVPALDPLVAYRPTLALVTQEPDSQGMSLTNGIEVVAAAVCWQYGLHPRHVILIEHYDDRSDPVCARLPGRLNGEKFSCVVFQEMRQEEAQPWAFHLRRPQWHPIEKAVVEAVIGTVLP